jgi:hypothetical protein
MSQGSKERLTNFHKVKILYQIAVQKNKYRKWQLNKINGSVANYFIILH